MSDQQVLVTGAAGFIGFHVAQRLLDDGRCVVGLDSLNDYYDPALKQARLDILQQRPGFEFVHANLADRPAMAALFARRFPVVIHLAAQAGVRYSIEHPHAYADANLEGFLNVLEGCRHNDCRHLLYASSSSVYGANKKMPFSVGDRVDNPISLYAATKKANELMAHSYSHLYRLPTTGLRFFTVYGPWGRPDMAYFSFTRKILAGEPIEVYGEGRMARDFTYVEDIVDGIVGALDRPPERGVNRILNIGDSRPVGLMDMIATLEAALGREAQKIMRPMQPGDVTRTYADVSKLTALTGYAPKVPLEEGLPRFVQWYRRFYP